MVVLKINFKKQKNINFINFQAKIVFLFYDDMEVALNQLAMMTWSLALNQLAIGLRFYIYIYIYIYVLD